MSSVSAPVQMMDLMTNTQDLLGGLKTFIANPSPDASLIPDIASKISAIVGYIAKENPFVNAITFASNLELAQSDSQKFTNAFNNNNTHDMIVYGLSLVSDCANVVSVFPDPEVAASAVLVGVGATIVREAYEKYGQDISNDIDSLNSRISNVQNAINNIGMRDFNTSADDPSLPSQLSILMTMPISTFPNNVQLCELYLNGLEGDVQLVYNLGSNATGNNITISNNNHYAIICADNGYVVIKSDGTAVKTIITGPQTYGQTSYDKYGNIVSSSTVTIDAAGNITNDYMKNDANGICTSETITTTSADGNTVNIKNLDGYGNTLSSSSDVTTTDAAGNTTEDYKEYDAKGNPISETITNSSTTLDSSGNIIDTINTTNLDGKGNPLSSSSDVTTTDSAGNTTEDYKEFDVNGTLTFETTTITKIDNSSTTRTFEATTGDQSISHQNAAGITDRVENITTDPDTGIKTDKVSNYDPISGNPIDTTTTITAPNGDQSIAHKNAAGITDRVENITTDPNTNIVTDQVKNYDPVSGNPIDTTTTSTALNGDQTITHQNAAGITDRVENITTDPDTGIKTDYQTTYDAGGGYKQSWSSSDGSSGENDKSDNGSTLNSTTNADGSSTTSTYDASTGVYGYDVVNKDGSSIDYQTTYDAGGGYKQSWQASNGTSGENDKSADGSTFTSRTNEDGSSTTSTFDASTGVYGYDVKNTDGSSIDYQTTYDSGGGYKQSWQASNGTTGENDKSDNGSTRSSTTNADGSSTTSTYDASTSVYGYDVKNTDGSSIDYQTTYDSGGGYKQSWQASNGTSLDFHG